MKKALIISIVTSFLLTSCKKEKNDNNLLFLLLLGLQQNSAVAFTGKFGGVSASLGKNSKALPDGITDVLAISSRNHYHRSKVDSSGNFSLNLVKGYSYIIIFIDSTLQVKGYYQLNSYGLNSIPTQYATNSINAGTLEKSPNSGTMRESYTPINNFNIDQFLTETGGLSLSEIGVVGAVSKELLPLLNIDTDGNGVIDLEEGLYTRLSFSQQWNIQNSISQAKNNFLDLNYLVNNLPSSTFAFFNIDKRIISDNVVAINYPNISNCNNSAGSMQINEAGNGFGSVPNANGSFTGNLPASTYTLGSYCLNTNTFLQFENGVYELLSSNKKFTYKNIEPFKITNNDTLLVPNIKFSEENGIIKSLEVKFQNISKNSIRDATDKEVNIVYGSTAGSGIGCSSGALTGSINDPVLFSCSFQNSKSNGFVTNCMTGTYAKYSSPVGVNFNSIRNCYIFINNSYGNTLGYSIN